MGAVKVMLRCAPLGRLDCARLLGRAGSCSVQQLRAHICICITRDAACRVRVCGAQGFMVAEMGIGDDVMSVACQTSLAAPAAAAAASHRRALLQVRAAGPAPSPAAAVDGQRQRVSRAQGPLCPPPTDHLGPLPAWI